MFKQKQQSIINKYFLIVFACLFSWVIQGKLLVSLAQNREEGDRQSQNKGCPQDVETLTSLMLKDLADYANRVIQRTQDSHRREGFDSYVVFAGKSEFEPLDLPQFQYNPGTKNNPKQIFFTTSERQYIDNTRKIETQNYHWLFLTQTPSGWRMVTMFSRFSPSTQKDLPTPPMETSNGIIGQAVNLWLRDCRAREQRGRGAGEQRGRGAAYKFRLLT
ncbi:MAG: hypothetical protein QNJ41_05345 [Xenococcaceae cyanobacterium MO_188.B32]|nr:hypothetical protein [Xenococcaceae cyanobacterium MO_188.B32]